MTNYALSIDDADLIAMGNNLTRQDLELDFIKPIYKAGESYTWTDDQGTEWTYVLPGSLDGSTNLVPENDVDFGNVDNYNINTKYQRVTFLANILTNTKRINVGSNVTTGGYTDASNNYYNFTPIDETSGNDIDIARFYKKVQLEVVKAILFFHRNYDLGSFIKSYPKAIYDSKPVDAELWWLNFNENEISAELNPFLFLDHTYDFATYISKSVLHILDFKLGECIDIISGTNTYIRCGCFLGDTKVEVYNSPILSGQNNIKWYKGDHDTTYVINRNDYFTLINKQNKINAVLDSINTKSDAALLRLGKDDSKLAVRQYLLNLAINFTQTSYISYKTSGYLDISYPIGIQTYKFISTKEDKSDQFYYDFYIKNIEKTSLSALPFIINSYISDKSQNEEVVLNGTVIKTGLLDAGLITGGSVRYPRIISGFNSFDYDIINPKESTTDKINNYGLYNSYAYLEAYKKNNNPAQNELLYYITTNSLNYVINEDQNDFLSNSISKVEFIDLYEKTVEFTKTTGKTVYGFITTTEYIDFNNTIDGNQHQLAKINESKFNVHNDTELETLIENSIVISDYIDANPIENTDTYFTGLFNEVLNASSDVGLNASDLTLLKEYINYFDMFTKVKILRMNDFSEIYFYNPFDTDRLELTKDIINANDISIHWRAALANNDTIATQMNADIQLVSSRSSLLLDFKGNYNNLYNLNQSNNKNTLSTSSPDVTVYTDTLSEVLETSKYENSTVNYEKQSHFDLLWYLIYDIEIYEKNYIEPLYNLRESYYTANQLNETPIDKYIFISDRLDFYNNIIEYIITSGTGTLKQYVQNYNSSDLNDLNSESMLDFIALFNRYIVYTNINSSNKIKAVTYTNVINKINTDPDVKDKVDTYNPFISNVTTGEYVNSIRSSIKNGSYGTTTLRNYLISFDYLFQSYLKTVLFETVHENSKTYFGTMMKKYPELLTMIKEDVSLTELKTKISQIETNDTSVDFNLTTLFNDNEQGLDLIKKSIKFKRFDTIKNEKVKYNRSIIDEILTLIDTHIDETEFLKVSKTPFYLDRIYQSMSDITEFSKYKLEHINQAIDEKFKSNNELLAWKTSTKELLYQSNASDLLDVIIKNRPVLSKFEDVILFLEANKDTEPYSTIYINYLRNSEEFIYILKDVKKEQNKLNEQEICELLIGSGVYLNGVFSNKTKSELNALIKIFVINNFNSDRVVNSFLQVDVYNNLIYKVYSEFKDIKDKYPTKELVIDKVNSNISFKKTVRKNTFSKFY